MITLIYVFMSLALLHYIYESIMLPSIRLKFRYRMFSLRDDLRRLRVQHGDVLNQKLYHHLQTSLNVTLDNLYRIDLAAFLTVHRRYQTDREFRERVERRARLLDELLAECPLPQVLDIRDEQLRVFRRVFLANAGSWFIYLIPAALVLLCFEQLKSFIRKISSIPEYEVTKTLAPPPPAPSA